ncbi:MAG: hypothetical protein WB508_09280 [Aeromicrobium sp.]
MTFARQGNSWMVDEPQSRTASCADLKIEDHTDRSVVDGNAPR